ncbi:MAG: alpha/beta hydrolase [Oscillospiraceae bacterium]|nr:alpha/beta hydrolase [Oscillospiraceae bacterium]
MENCYLDSAGKGKIFCRVWEPQGEVRAVLQIVHGVAEHTERYDDFARFLNQKGILVAAEDHMGHGKSLGEGDVQGFFFGGWEAAVADSRQLQERLQKEYPDVPCFLLGHSMGSFMVRTMLISYPDSGIRGAIVSGTGWQPTAALKLGARLCGSEAKKRGEQAVSPLINKMVFGGYNRHFQPVRTPHDWICTDEAVVDRYEADPLCGFDATVGLSRDMFSGIRRIQNPENLKKMQKDLPVWFFSGSLDPVGNRGKGVRKTVEAFRRAGMRDVSVTLYEGYRHEMLNERNKTQVYADVLRFLETHIN